MQTLLTNGRIHSLSVDKASAMLLDGTRIGWIGCDASAVTMPADRTVDLDGALVIPAFVDAHFHATGTGLALTGLDLSGSPDLPSALDRLEHRARRSGGRPLLGSGWDEARWPEGRAPTRRELDRASYGGVVYLARTDAHSAVVSSALMAAIPGLDSLAGYRPDGLLTRDAHHAVRAAVLQTISGGQRSDLHRAALRAAAANGIVALHEMAGPEISGAEDLDALLSMARDETLPQVFGYWGELGGVARARELGAVGAGGDLFCDGSLGSHTAGLGAPYADADTSGYLRFRVDELAAHIEECTVAGLQAGFHAIGDAAVTQVVHAMQLAAARLEPGRVRAAGHRIEHAELIPSIVDFAATGLLASVQPAFDASWGGSGGMYAQRLGVERAMQLNPFAKLAAAGVELAFGSDSPVTALDPWAAISAAVHPSNPDHALTFEAALHAHTRAGWRFAHADADGSGVLEPGAPASYAVFDAPPGPIEGTVAASASAPDSVSPRCLRTVLRGRELFDSGELR
jgi:predicted amidohydrolase YtcJ